jgi:hypothetical protein
VTDVWDVCCALSTGEIGTGQSRFSLDVEAVTSPLDVILAVQALLTT